MGPRKTRNQASTASRPASGGKRTLNATLEQVVKNIKAAGRRNVPPKTPTPPLEEEDEEIVPEDEVRDPTPHPQPPDVSEVTYELNISAFLGSEAVITKARHHVLKAFKLQPFLAEAIKTIAQRTESNDNIIQWDKGRAEMRHKGLKKASDYSKNDVFDEHDH